jgi:tRNA pseudouridine55 synthase
VGDDGLLNINKPPDCTSYSLVAAVKRGTGVRRVGHGGTLDPQATGVILLCLGQGTRMAEYLADSTKGYRAEIELGVETDTYDGEGQVVARQDPAGVSRADVEAALGQFRGVVFQRPPIYSALKRQGQRLYDLARSGVAVAAPEPRRTEVLRLELIGFELPVVTVETECSRGFYIRSLAHDLGQALGCGAYLKSLVRLRVGQFRLEDAIPLAAFQAACAAGTWRQFLQPLDVAVKGWPALVLDRAAESALRQGKATALEGHILRAYGCGGLPLFKLGRCRAYGAGGNLVALIGPTPDRRWRPLKVFPSDIVPSLEALEGDRPPERPS